MISSLSVEQCRAFTDRQFKFGPKTLITGPNGSGKSTVLEIIRVLSVGKSFRTSRLEELVRFDEKFLRLTLTTSANQKVEFFYGSQFASSEGRDRQLNYNGNATSWTDFLGVLPTVLFTPSDIAIVLAGPDVRRRYLDSVLWQVDPNYRQSQLEFTQALREKAALLFMVKLNRAAPDELAPWNELITNQTAVIRAGRVKYVDYLNQELGARSQKPEAGIHLKYQFDNRPVLELQNQEIKTTQNLYGPHRDELVIEYDDFSARRFASRGQSRLVVAYLKAAEADYLAAKTDNPVSVLLDDALSELDGTNVQKILDLFNPKHQLFLTAATDLKLPSDWEIIKI